MACNYWRTASPHNTPSFWLAMAVHALSRTKPLQENSVCQRFLQNARVHKIFKHSVFVTGQSRSWVMIRVGFSRTKVKNIGNCINWYRLECSWEAGCVERRSSEQMNHSSVAIDFSRKCDQNIKFAPKKWRGESSDSKIQSRLDLVTRQVWIRLFGWMKKND